MGLCFILQMGPAACVYALERCKYMVLTDTTRCSFACFLGDNVYVLPTMLLSAQ